MGPVKLSVGGGGRTGSAPVGWGTPFSPRAAVPDERPSLVVGDRVGRLGIERDHPKDDRDLVEAALVIAADVLSHLVQGFERGPDVCDRAEGALPGAALDGGEGAGRPYGRGRGHILYPRGAYP